MDQRVSIVIIGRNEESGIGKCIDAALDAAEQIGGAEMIYVDSHSTDNTVAVARGSGVSVVMLDPALRRSPSAGRHAGSLVAKGGHILFLDADTIMYRDFLPAAIAMLDADPNLGGVSGRIDDLDEAGEQIFDVDERSDEIMDVKWLRGPSCLYRRDALLQAGSFNPNLAMEEEAELGLRIIRSGWSLKVIPVPMSCHTRCYHPRSLSSTFSTFMRDIRANRIGEITRTIRYAFNAGNGLEFCWMRLKTTIVFTTWLLLIAFCLLLPAAFYPIYAAVAIFILGALAIFAKKKSFAQTLTFGFAKLLNLVDIIAGIHLIRIKAPVDPGNIRQISLAKEN